MTPERRLVSRLQFWQLYQFDSAFSLQAGKATSIPDGSYMVEAPSLIPWKVKTRVSPQHQVIFFTLTRLAQVQRKISQLFGVRGHARTGFESRVLEGTLDTLVKEVTRILDESQLVERYRTATGNMQWYYGDILFNVHTTMTLLYRAESHGGAVPAPALLNARAAINLMKELYTKFPRGRHWNIGYLPTTVYYPRQHLLTASSRFVCFYPFIPYFTLFCNLLATVDADVTSARADLTLTEWLQSTIQEISQDREGLDRFAGILKRLNTVAEYFVRMKEGPASDGTAMGTEMDVEVHMLMGEELSMGDFDFSLDEFLLSPVEYARMLETVVVSGDAHQEWWNGNESMRM